MIYISSLQRTAEELMAKAAIEIPDDYLAGLRRCADTEKGDLSAFVIKAMLENYDAAKEDRRAMCGDTGLPRWRRHCDVRPLAPPQPCRCVLIACIRSGAPITTTTSASARRRSSTRSIPRPIGSISSPCTKAACSA